MLKTVEAEDYIKNARNLKAACGTCKSCLRSEMFEIL